MIKVYMLVVVLGLVGGVVYGWLLYSFDAADDLLCVGLGGCRFMNNKNDISATPVPSSMINYSERT